MGTALSPWVALVSSLLTGCGGSKDMAGFSEREARASEKRELIDACTLREGRLVLEVESALVREYPHVEGDELGQKKQPLILLWVRQAGGGPGAEAITFEVAPEAYAAGDTIRHFQGKRLLDQPARLVHGRALDVRLAENNRTAEPEWRRVAGEVSGVGSMVLAGTPRGGIDAALGWKRRATSVPLRRPRRRFSSISSRRRAAPRPRLSLPQFRHESSPIAP